MRRLLYGITIHSIRKGESMKKITIFLLVSFLFSVTSVFAQAVVLDSSNVMHKLGKGSVSRLDPKEAPAMFAAGTVPIIQQNIPLIIREEDGGGLFVWTDRFQSGTRMYARVTVPGGGFPSDLYEFIGDFYPTDGQLVGFQVPRVVGSRDVTVEAFAFLGSVVVGYTSTTLDSTSQTALVVAAYEQGLPPQGPFSSAGANIKLAGSFDSSQPAEIFAGTTRLTSRVKTETKAGNYPQETTITVSEELARFLGFSYPLTICQSGMCSTVKVKHIFGPLYPPTFGGKG